MLTIVGLVYDMVGVAILARGFALVSKPYLRAAMLGGNTEEFPTALQFRTDARYGVLLVLLGFLLQIFGAAGVSVSTALTLVLGLLALLPFLVLYEWHRRRVVKASLTKKYIA